MLSDYDWADRMAIPVPFIQAVGRPDAPAFMAAFTAWRWSAPLINRKAWLHKVWTNRIHPQPVGTVNTAPNNPRRAAFFDELLRKCNNLYGGSDTAADPLALARHPWTLTPKEFEKNYQEITGGDLPDAAIDERRSMSVRTTLIDAFPTAAGLVIAVSMPWTGAAIGLAGVGIVVSGAAIDSSRESERERQLGLLRSKMSQYAEIYRKEAGYREKENNTTAAGS